MPNCEIKILGGFPVDVDFDVDDMGVHVNEFYKVEKRRRRARKLGNWVWKRIEGINGEMERIEEALYEDYISECESSAGSDAYDRMMDRKMGY